MSLTIELVAGPACGLVQTFPEPYNLDLDGRSCMPRVIVHEATGTEYVPAEVGGSLLVSGARQIAYYAPRVVTLV